MKILLTGSSGFIGQAITPRLEKDYELFHLKNDLTDHAAIKAEVNSVDPDIIVHLAARTEVEKSFYEQISFSEVNYIGTLNLIESAKTLKHLKNFVFASTMEVYGWQPISDEIEHTGMYTERVTFDENTIPNPNAPYLMRTLSQIPMLLMLWQNMVVKNIWNMHIVVWVCHLLLYVKQTHTADTTMTFL